MPEFELEGSFSDYVAQALPYLRRYARALTGSQARGDQYTMATLEALLKDRSIAEDAPTIREGVFQCFHAIWSSSGRNMSVEEADNAAIQAYKHLAKLTENSREVLLLNTIEEFDLSQIARIINASVEEVEVLLDAALTEIAESASGRVLIIEDEPIIAEDIQDIVTDLGHRVVGIARTRAEAVELGKAEEADLILADIQLADNSSGIDAVNDLLGMHDAPVVFITAFPERLLTGDKPEPAFLISKPFSVAQVRSAVSQAMFFASTETLRAS